MRRGRRRHRSATRAHAGVVPAPRSKHAAILRAPARSATAPVCRQTGCPPTRPAHCAAAANPPACRVAPARSDNAGWRRGIAVRQPALAAACCSLVLPSRPKPLRFHRIAAAIFPLPAPPFAMRLGRAAAVVPVVRAVAPGALRVAAMHLAFAGIAAVSVRVRVGCGCILPAGFDVQPAFAASVALLRAAAFRAPPPSWPIPPAPPAAPALLRPARRFHRPAAAAPA